MGVTIYRPGQRLVIPGVRVMQTRADSAFSPASLPGLTGWWDLLTPSSLFQDSGGTTPVTAAGQPVGLWQNLVGSNHVSQATAGSRPTYQTTGVTFDGVDDRLAGAAISNYISSSAYTIFVAGRVTTVATNSANGYDNEAFLGDVSGFSVVFARNVPRLGAYNWDGNADQAEVAYTLNTDVVVSTKHAGGNLHIWIDATTASVASGNTSTLTGALELGRNSGTNVNCLDGRIFGVIMCNQALNETQRQATVAWMKARYAIA